MCTVNAIRAVTACAFKMPAHTNNSSHLSLDCKNQHPYITACCIFTEAENIISIACICCAWFQPQKWLTQCWKKSSDTLITWQQYNNKQHPKQSSTQNKSRTQTFTQVRGQKRPISGTISFHPDSKRIHFAAQLLMQKELRRRYTGVCAPATYLWASHTLKCTFQVALSL